MEYIDFKNKLLTNFKNPDLFKRSALEEKEGHNTLKKIFENKGYKKVLEIGTYRGLSAAWISYYVNEVITIDLEYGLLDFYSKRFNFPVFPRYYDIWDFLDIKNIHLKLVKNDIEKYEFINAIDFDIAFIDGDHIGGIINDFEYCKKCKKILFHDYDNSKNNTPYTLNFIKSLSNIGKLTEYPLFALWEEF